MSYLIGKTYVWKSTFNRELVFERNTDSVLFFKKLSKYRSRQRNWAEKSLAFAVNP